MKAYNSVSVIIPNFNHSRHIEKAIHSCIIQGEYLKEVIVVDDHSTDNSREVLERCVKVFPEKLSYYTSPEKGGNNARNYGFTKATGSFIQWLDADDTLLPGKFRTQVNELIEREELDVVYSDWYMDYYDKSEGRINRIECKKGSYKDFLYEILADNWSVPSSYLYRRRIAEKLAEIGAWNPRRKIAQDREYVTLAALCNAEFGYVSGYFAVYNKRTSATVSTMKFKKRLKYQLELEEEFRSIIRIKKDLLLPRRKYFSLLNAHAMNASFYAPSLTITSPFLPTNVEWGLIHWKKLPLMPIIYVVQHLKYGIKKLNRVLSRRQKE